MQKLLDEVKDGSFAKRWIEENKSGRPWFNKRRQAEMEHQIESVGREMRRMMPFLDAKEMLPGLRGAQAPAGAGASAAKKTEKEVPVAGVAR
jgi:ketol-acid reductoisomerase